MIIKYKNIYGYLIKECIPKFYIEYNYPCYRIYATRRSITKNKLYIISITLDDVAYHLKNNISISKKDVEFIMDCQDEDIIKLFILKLINERL